MDSQPKHPYKLPGKTLAESLGLDIPDDAPGGHRLANVADLLSGHPTGSTRARAQNIRNTDYDGFYDHDAHGGPNNGGNTDAH